MPHAPSDPARSTPGIHAAFEAQARRRPDAPALVAGDRIVSYATLDARASRLAGRLVDLGVGPEEAVAVCCERSVEQLVTLLAVLKSGAAYLPLDPSWPDERLRFIMDDARVRVLVGMCSRAALGRSVAHVIDVDDPHTLADGAEPAPPSAAVTPDRLAYICYTSGSTGVPKGVAVTHGNVLARVTDVDYVRLDETRHVLHAAPAAFDATTFEVWGPLLNGGRCVLLSQRVPTPAALQHVLRQHAVTTAFLTTALLNALVDDDPGVLAPLDQLLFGGEAVSVRHVRRLQDACPRLSLVHVYGPTETTTFATAHPISGPIDPASRTIPIGRPIARTSAHVLDPDGRPVATGETGEAFLGGEGVARGYHGRAELTASRFVPDPFSDAPGARLYRTGDLVRADATGALEFVGRLDHQVKIRGHRIEPGEIEARLLSDPEVGSAVVTCREDRPGDKRLAAYLVGRDGAPVDAEAVRRRLRAELPSYMVPVHWTVLERMPLSPNGKVDRRALPAPAPEPSAVAAARPAHAEPAGPVEREVAAGWSELLGVSDPGVDDDFLDAGGDSLLAMRLLARVRRQFGVDLSIAAFFRQPTIAAVASRVEAVNYLREGEQRSADDGSHEVLWL